MPRGTCALQCAPRSPPCAFGLARPNQKKYCPFFIRSFPPPAPAAHHSPRTIPSQSRAINHDSSTNPNPPLTGAESSFGRVLYRDLNRSSLGSYHQHPPSTPFSRRRQPKFVDLAFDLFPHPAQSPCPPQVRPPWSALFPVLHPS